MILVDSSAFIEYYRPSGLPKVRDAVAEVIAEDLVAVNGVIQVEILAFVSGRASFQTLWNDFKSFHWLHLGEEDFDHATEMGFSLRQRGITVPAADLIIAASAIRGNAVVYHSDSHYDLISQYCGLSSKNLRP